MIWVRAIALVTISEIPLIGDDVMFAGGSTVEMDDGSVWGLFPGEVRLTVGGDTLHHHGFADIIYTTVLGHNDEANLVGTGFIILVIGRGAVTLVTISKYPLIRRDIEFAGGGAVEVYGGGVWNLLPVKISLALSGNALSCCGCKQDEEK